MGVPVIYGTKVDARYVGDKVAFCGACLDDTEHGILALEQRSHLYFIPFGTSADVGRVLRCETCKVVVPYVKRDGAPADEQKVDAFLDAHVLPLERADKSLWVGVAGVGVAVFAVSLYSGFWQLADSFDLPAYAYWIGAGAALLATVLGYFYCKRAIGDWLLGRHADARRDKLLELTSWSAAQVTQRAAERGLKRLASFLSARAPA